MFSLVNGVLLQPLPYPHADRLLITPVSLPDFADLREASRSFDGMAVWGSNRYMFGSEGAASEPVLGAVVSEGFFPLLGARRARARSGPRRPAREGRGDRPRPVAAPIRRRPGRARRARSGSAASRTP